MTDDSYKWLTATQHVYEASGMYLGCTKSIPMRTWALGSASSPTAADASDKTPPLSGAIVLIDTRMSLGLQRLFVEGLSNCCDNYDRTISKSEELKVKIPQGTISVTFDGKRVTMSNGGYPIEVRKHNTFTDRWVPELIFTELRSGTSFTSNTTKRHGAGANGVGGTLIGLFSTKSSLRVEDSFRKLSYEHEWEDHLVKTVKQEIAPFTGRASRVTIAYDADLKLFEMEEYPPEADGIFEYLCTAASFFCGLPVVYNGKKIQCSDLDYAKLLAPSAKNFFFHYEWPEGAKVTKNKDGTQTSPDGALPTLKLVLADSPGVKNSVCNGLVTIDGGVHIDSACDKVFEILNPLFKQETEGKLRLTQKFLVGQLTVIVAARLVNPGWNGQIKSKVLHTESKLEWNIPGLECCLKWGIAEAVSKKLLESQLNILKKTDHKKGKKKSGKSKVEDCKWASDKSKRAQVIFAINEGDSAKNYGRYIREYTKDGNHRMILLSLEGKIRNMLKFRNKLSYDDILKLVKDNVFSEIKSSLGLTTESEVIEELRAATIMLMMDADLDGLHIIMLVLALFERFFPFVLKANMMQVWQTKIVRCTRKRARATDTVDFYSLAEFTRWREQNPGWHAEYYKGLGTSTKEDAMEDVKNWRTVKLIYDGDASATIRMAMSNEGDNKKLRREWILSAIPCEEAMPGTLNLSAFVRDYFISYALATLTRHIPGRDGLMTTKRKVIHTSYGEWGKWTKSHLRRVDLFSGQIMCETNYHHGDSSGVLCGLAQHIVGKPYPLFVASGQFGSRVDTKPSAARYLKTCPVNWLMRNLFNPEFAEILEYKTEDDMLVEPYFYVPPIPGSLLLGANAVAMGWRSYIPCYNPLELVEWYSKRIAGEVAEVPIPWWQGFKGDVELTDTHVITCGILTKVKSLKSTTRYHITELPVGVWTKAYLEVLDDLKEKKVISGYEDAKVTDSVDITVTSASDSLTLDDLKLIHSEKLSNLTLVDENGKPMVFATVLDLMEDYYHWCLSKYTALREMKLANLLLAIDNKQGKIKYIEHTLSGKLRLRIGAQARPEGDILADIESLGLEVKYYAELADKQKSREAISREKKLLEQLNKEYAALGETSPESIWQDRLAKFKSDLEANL